MSWYSFQPRMTVGQRRRQAQLAAQKLGGKAGRVLAPVRLAGTKISTTFWGKAWCDNLESYSDYANRLPRGRSYVRSGSVLDLQISAGRVEAMVQGSSLYKIAITFSALSAVRWADIKNRTAGKLTNLLDLLQGRLSKEILAEITAPQTGLFPAPQEIKLQCSCPDWADMCKHVAAVLYGVGARLDEKPELFFTLRGVDVQELITTASLTASAAGPDAQAGASLGDDNLSEIFGIELEAPKPVRSASPESPNRVSTASKRKPKETPRPRPLKKAGR